MTRPCGNCTHPQHQHSSIAGCLHEANGTYCPCIRYMAAGATVEPSRAQDLAEGHRRADEGAQAAGSAAPGALATDWRLKAETRLAELIQGGTEFSADDLVEATGMPPVANMVGAVFRKAAQQDRIRAVGFTQSTRPEAHARVQRTWKGQE